MSCAEDLRNITFTDYINHNVKAVIASILKAVKKSVPHSFRKEYEPY